VSTSENLGSKLNRKCKTCFNCFPSISFRIIYYNGTHVIYTVLDQYIINTDRKQLKQTLHFRFSFEPRFSEVDKSLFLAPPLRTTSCNVHYSGSILYDNGRETWSKSNITCDTEFPYNRKF
jgi:uncharacterized protein (DUF2132 family)